MTDTPRSNAISPVVFMGSGGPDPTAPEAVERLAKYHDWRDDGDSETAATLRAISAALEAERKARMRLLNARLMSDDYTRAEAAEQALAEMTRRRDRWMSIAEGQDFTRVYLETCAERDTHKARAEALDAKLKEAVEVMRMVGGIIHNGDDPDGSGFFDITAAEIEQVFAFLASIGDKP